MNLLPLWKSLLFVSFFFNAVSARTDMVTTHVTFNCPLHKYYHVNAWVTEVDDWVDDEGGKQIFGCSDHQCKIDVLYMDDGDGPFNKKYELNLSFEHNCTPDPSNANVLYFEERHAGYFQAPVGKDTELNLTVNIK